MNDLQETLAQNASSYEKGIQEAWQNIKYSIRVYNSLEQRRLEALILHKEYQSLVANKVMLYIGLEKKFGKLVRSQLDSFTVNQDTEQNLVVEFDSKDGSKKVVLKSTGNGVFESEDGDRNYTRIPLQVEVSEKGVETKNYSLALYSTNRGVNLYSVIETGSPKEEIHYSSSGNSLLVQLF